MNDDAIKEWHVLEPSKRYVGVWQGTDAFDAVAKYLARHTTSIETTEGDIEVREHKHPWDKEREVDRVHLHYNIQFYMNVTKRERKA